MLFTLRTTHMPAAGWRLCVDGVEIVWRCTCAHPQDTGATDRAGDRRREDERETSRYAGPAELCVSMFALPELVEAASRTGQTRLAADALGRLAEAASAGGTD
jgi:hypothetical protein